MIIFTCFGNNPVQACSNHYCRSPAALSLFNLALGRADEVDLLLTVWVRHVTGHRWPPSSRRDSRQSWLYFYENGHITRHRTRYEGSSSIVAALQLEVWGWLKATSASLWSVLKHSIGKNLTTIGFLVFFNEPMSMLQRMVCFLVCLLYLGSHSENFCFGNWRILSFQSVVPPCALLLFIYFLIHDFWLLVDAFFSGNSWERPLHRVAFVAVFDMANYSSTAGHIAKPFNPMLVILSSSFLEICSFYL